MERPPPRSPQGRLPAAGAEVAATVRRPVAPAEPRFAGGPPERRGPPGGLASGSERGASWGDADRSARSSSRGGSNGGSTPGSNFGMSSSSSAGASANFHSPQQEHVSSPSALDRLLRCFGRGSASRQNSGAGGSSSVPPPATRHDQPSYLNHHHQLGGPLGHMHVQEAPLAPNESLALPALREQHGANRLGRAQRPAHPSRQRSESFLLQLQMAREAREARDSRETAELEYALARSLEERSGPGQSAEGAPAIQDAMERARRLHLLTGLPREKYSCDHHHHLGECELCLVDYENGDDLLRLPCMHFFHAGCVMPWLQKSPTCPVCQIDVCQAVAQSLGFGA